MRSLYLIASVGLLLGQAACRTLPEAPRFAPPSARQAVYQIAPGNSLEIKVWRNEQLSMTVTVRPDGMISFPIVGELVAAEKSAAALSQELEGRLEGMVQKPNVTINITNAKGILQDQVRVIGEATNPRTIQYQRNMTVLDLLIDVGGLTEFADGNRCVLIRAEGGEEKRYRVRLDDLIRDGDISANVQILPGDILIIPETFL